MRYAITGATGFVGGVLAAQLRAAGHEVVALVRDTGKAGRLSELGVAVQSGDLGSTESLDELCRDVDGLFHVAGWYKLGSRNPEQGVRINVDGTRNVLVAARKAAVPRVVYTS
ncbi:MAG: NAD-dependent epimerase/dehydratase family protein, partial [Jiangellaceae bacterium]